MALLELEKLKRDIGILFKNVKCLMAKSDETSPLVATEWSSRHINATGHGYTAGTYVFYQGHVYKALYNNESVLPTNTTYWLDLGEGHLLAEEQADWSSTGGRNFILNKPTKTSHFTNDGEDGSSPYVTQDELNNALPIQDLDSVLGEGDQALDKGAYIKEIGFWDNFASPFAYAKMYANKSRIYMKSKLGNDMFHFSETGWAFIKSPFTFNFNFQTLTSNRTATFQNKSGVVAYLSDIQAVSLKLFTQTANSPYIESTTTETSLIGKGIGTLEVPADIFQEGDAFRAILKGIISSQKGETLHIRVKTASGVLLMDTGVMTLPSCTDKFWNLDLDFTIRNTGVATEAVIASGGIFSFVKDSSTSYEGVCFNFINDTTFDTTVSNSLEITAEWGSTNSSNKIFSRLFTLSRV
ncbi:MAG: hypothetical protein E6R13_07270 [Spirochaetes bacterium]|nr:MAG: hypothetical protein E6R13_07270 [Spirochaetota bacterium]